MDEFITPFIPESENSMFRNFKLWSRSKGEVLYVFQPRYSDKSYAARLIAGSDSDDQVIGTMSLIPGLPDNDGALPHSFFSLINLGGNEEHEPNLFIEVSYFIRETSTYFAYGMFRYDRNGKGGYSGEGRTPHNYGINNYDKRKFGSELYNPYDLPKRIDLYATATSFFDNIRNGDFSLPELVRD